jgi:hypothetical protein
LFTAVNKRAHKGLLLGYTVPEGGRRRRKKERIYLSLLSLISL